MSIPESQLDVWANQGAIVTAKSTHQSVRLALSSYDGWPQGRDYEVYLQGSYKNDTNIRGDSDVDLVVQLNSTFQYDVSELSEYEKSLFDQRYSNVTYGWSSFRSDVLKALQKYYGSSKVSEGKNCLNVAAGSNRLPADVLVCLQYRRYLSFDSLYREQYVEGVLFYTRPDQRKVINFPKQHYDHGVTKNSRYVTDGWFKPVVRIFKNARTYLINQNVITGNVAPSYFLQCLLYNAPNNLFGGSYNRTFLNILNWLYETDYNEFVCQNEQVYLFGTTPEQWSINSANKFKNSIIELWNEW